MGRYRNAPLARRAREKGIFKSFEAVVSLGGTCVHSVDTSGLVGVESPSLPKSRGKRLAGRLSTDTVFRKIPSVTKRGGTEYPLHSKSRAPGPSGSFQ